jgi:DNA-binding transcriptional LysR family regulator
MQWDDLRYVLAVHRAGSAAGAARALGVSNVTVFRRIEAIEKSLGVRLFDRKRTGYIATPAAEDMVEQALQIEDQLKALERRVWKQDSRVHGSVSLTVTDTYSLTLAPGLLAGLRRRYPDIHVELLVYNDLLNISKRDADIAIRATSSPPENLIGHHVAPLVCAIYAAREFATRHLKRSKDLSRVPWVMLSEKFAGHREYEWIRRQGYDKCAVVRANSFLAVSAAIKGGLGVGIMSPTTAWKLGGLVPVSPPIRELEVQIWILTHPELRNVARVAAVYSYLREELIKLKPRFEMPE